MKIISTYAPIPTQSRILGLFSSLLFLLAFSIPSMSQVSTFPWTEDFEGESTCGTSCGSTCTLSGDFTQDATGDRDWIVDIGPSGSSGGTGPVVDHTTGTGSGKYLYTEASSCASQTYAMISPFFNLTSLGDAKLSFWYHMYGSNMGDLYIESRIGSTGAFARIDSLKGQQQGSNGAAYSLREISLSAVAGQDSFQFRVVGITGSSFNSDMAVDDFSLAEVVSNDAGIVSVINPPTLHCYSTDSIVVKVKNDGGNTITALSINWNVDLMVNPPANFTGLSIASGADTNLTLGSFAFNSLSHSFTATINTVNAVADPVTSNDTLVQNIMGPAIATVPFSADFELFTGANMTATETGFSEGSGAGSPSGTTSNWLSSSATQETAFGTSTAKVNLYTGARYDWILSDAFVPAAGDTFTFKAALTNFNSAGTDVMGSDDSLRITISTDCGNTFQYLMTFDVNNPPPNALTSYGISLTPYIGQTIILGIYASDGPVDNSEDYDIHVDDLFVGTPPNDDAGVSALVSPNPPCDSLDSIRVEIENFASDPLNTVTVVWSIDGAPQTPANFTGLNLTSGQTTTVTIGSFAFAAGTSYSLSMATSNPNGNTDGNNTNDTLVQSLTKSAISNVPLTADFESFTGSNMTTTEVGWSEASGAGVPSGTTSLWTSSNTTQETAFGTSTAKVNLYTGSRYVWIVSDKFVPVSGDTFTFKAALTNFNSATPDVMGSDDSLRIVVSTDCGNTFQYLMTFDVNNPPPNALTAYGISLTPYVGQAIILGVYASDGPVDNSEDYDIHVDDLFVGTPPSCAVPSALSATSISTTGASIGWVDNNAPNATLWEIEYDTLGYAQGAGTKDTTSANPYALSGLAAGTDYEVYVRAICGPADTSAWAADSVSFKTLAPPVSLPYSNDFESGSPLSDFQITLGSQSESNLDASSTCSGTNALQFSGKGSTGFSGGSTSATASQAWTTNTTHHTTASLTVDATGAVGGLNLNFDLKQEYSYGNKYSWFRVLVNGTQISPDYNPTTQNADPCTNYFLDLSAYLGTTFTLSFQSSNKYNDASGSGGQGDHAFLDNVSIVVPPANDAEPTAVVNPLAHCNTGDSIRIAIKNNGLDTLNSLTINWNVDAMINPPVNLTGLGIVPNATDTVTIGFFAFNSNSHTLTAIVSAPNGGVDGDVTNDTLVATINAAMNGTYTINSGAATTGTNFASFADLATALSANGVCSSVTVNVVAASGPYIEQVMFENISGTSASNTITINGNGETLQFTNTSSNNYVVNFNGVSYFSIDSLVMSVSGTPSYGRVIAFSGANDHISVKNSTLNGRDISSTSNAYHVVYDNTGVTNQLENLAFINNTVNNGSYGLYFYGSSSTVQQDSATVMGNTFSGFYDHGVYFVNSTNVVVQNNTLISDTDPDNSTRGAYFSQAEPFKFIGNSVTINGATTSEYSEMLYVTACDATAGEHNMIANNMLAHNNPNVTSSSGEGIYISSSDYTDIWHNSINVLNGGSTSEGLYMVSMGSNNVVQNNSVVHLGAGKAAHYSSAPAIASYNNFYAPNGSIMGTGTQGPNGLNVDPVYTSATDLHVVAGLLNAAATPIASVTTDKDGEARDGTNPDIGADEFTPPPNDVGATSFLVNNCDSTDSLRIIIQNFSTDTATGFPVIFNVNGGANYTFNYSGTLLPSTSDTIAVLDTALMGGAVYNYIAYTSRFGDTDNSNDTARFSLLKGDYPAVVTINSGGGGTGSSPYAGEIYWSLVDSLGGVIDSTTNGTYSAAGTYNVDVCLVASHPYTFRAYDSFGDGWNGNTYEIKGCGGNITVANNGGVTPNNGASGAGLETSETFYINSCPTNDVGVTQIIAPNSACALTNSETVQVVIQNFALASASGFSINYTLNGGSAFTQAYTGSLAASSTDTVSFSTTADLSAISTFNIVAYTVLAGDEDLSNDTNAITVVHDSAFTQFPYLQDFESFTVATNATGYTAGWSTNPANTTGAYRWNVDEGKTPTGGFNPTGPEVDHTTGAATGNYLYTEASQGAATNEATVTSPCFDLSQMSNPFLDLWYHFHGANVGDFYLEVATQPGGSWIAIDSIKGQQQSGQSDAWLKLTENLAAYKNDVVKFRMRSLRGSSFNGDMAVDDFRLYDAKLNDIGLIAFAGPDDNCSATDTIKAVVRNFGVNTQTTFNMQYTLNGGSAQTFAYSGSLASNATDTVSIVPATSFTLGNNTINAWTALAGDEDLSNDSNSTTHFRGNFPVTVTINVTNSFPTEKGWVLNDLTSGVSIDSVPTGSYSTAGTYSAEYCIIENNNYQFTAYDGYGDGWDGATYALTSCNNLVTLINNGGASPNDSDGTTNTLDAEVTETFTASCPMMDAGITRVASPDSICSGSTSDTVSVWIKNYGIDTITSIPVMYAINGGSFATAGTATGNLGYLDSLMYQFVGMWGGTGDIALAVTTNLSGETNRSNDTASSTITHPTPIALFSADTNVTCNGLSDGIINLSDSAGYGGFTYAWSNSATTQDLSGLAAGTYTVTATDAFGCTATYSTTISEPAVLVASVSSDSNVSCNGLTDAGITASATGGTTNYTYAWSNGSTIASISGLAAGTYSVTISDANGCTDSASYTVTQPAVLVSNASVDSNVTCNSFSNGGATASATGGMMTYTYSWSNSATSASITGVVAGTYSVTVTDANGCTDSSSITITEPTMLTVSASAGTNPTCNGGNNGIGLSSVSGGTSPFTYLWSSGSTSSAASNLTAGTSTITVTDANGCTTSNTVTLSEPTAISTTVTTSNNISCNGLSDGKAYVAASGGTGTLTYAWSSGSMTDTATGLSNAIHYVTVSDANGCSTLDSAVITQPSAVTVSIGSVLNAGCNGASTGSAVASGSGGTGAISYGWNNGASTSNNTGLAAGTYTVTATDANGCTATDSATITEPTALSASITTSTNVACKGDATGTATASGAGGTTPYTYLWSNGDATAAADSLAQGMHTVTITDANGCSDNTSVTLTEPATNVAASVTSTTNASTVGGTNGQATAGATGGVTPYTYAWSNATSNATATGLGAGTYTIVVTDGNGCTDTDSAIITDPSSPTAVNITAFQNISCNGGSDGYAVASGSGGTSPYTYLWSNASSADSIGGLATGTYSVVLTDGFGITDTAFITLTEPAILSASYSGQQNVGCNGDSTGQTQVNVIGGTSPYNYMWSNGTTSALNTNLAATSYTVTVTDANGCTLISSTTITEPTTLVAAASLSNNVSCNNGSDGSATVGNTGGTSPFTFAWSNGDVGSTADSLPAAIVFVTVTDGNGCASIDSVSITEPIIMTVSLDSTRAVSCNGLTDGQAFTSASGGTAPYTYNWTNSTTGATLTAGAGSYQVFINDANGCLDSIAVTLTEPTLLSATIDSSNNVTCNAGTDGAVFSSATGGTMPHTYAWSNAGSASSITGVGANTYNVTATDANGCTSADTIMVTEPAAIGLTIDSVRNVSCNGLTDGYASVAATGGTSPFTYAWSNSIAMAANNNVGAGTYTVTVTDANGCSSIDSATVTTPTALTMSNDSLTNVSCNGAADGYASYAVSGGTMPYTYLWTNAGTSTTISGQAAGTYSLLVTDANGCSIGDSLVITEPMALSSSIDSTLDVSCNGGSNGYASVAATGGTMPYTYAWDNSTATAANTGLMAGGYNVTVTDANGCSVTDSATVAEPAVLAMSNDSLTNVSCNAGTDGYASYAVSGGTMPYTYLWTNAATTNAISGVGTGSYGLLVTDANGCTVGDTVTITEPTMLMASIASTTNGSCGGATDGMATASSTGGTAPYTYMWSNGDNGSTADSLGAGTVMLTVMDANGCTSIDSDTITVNPAMVTNTTATNPSCVGGANGDATGAVTSGGTAPFTYTWSNGDMGSTADSLSAGTYFLTVTDGNGCTVLDSATIADPAAIVTNVTATDATCNGDSSGASTASVTSGGVAPFTYSWSNGVNAAANTSLPAGTYFVTIADANGCSTNDSAVIGQPAAIIVSATGVDANCGAADGQATATVNGGVGTLTYAWSNGGTTAAVTGLSAGTYSVVVTDGSGCTGAATVIINNSGAPSVSISSTTILCNGDTNGNISSAVTGGTAPYTYTWNTGDTTANLNNVGAGVYTLNVADGNGCIASAIDTVTEPNTLGMAIASQNPSCAGGDGSAMANVTGGTMPYTYAWNNSGATANINNLNAGNFAVMVTDANGCMIADSVLLIQATPPSVTAFGQDETCAGQGNGLVYALGTGGTGTLTYAWSNGANTDTVTGIGGGTYTVIVTDAGGCSATDTVSISTLATAPIVALGADTSFCAGGSVTLDAGNVGSSFAWSNGATLQQITVDSNGQYSVVVTNASGCSATDTVGITVFPGTSLTTFGNNATCGNSDGSAQVVASGGFTPLTYAWSNGAMVDTLNGIAAGNYDVTVTTSNGCSSTATVSISNVGAPTVMDTATDVSCNGGSDGMASVAVTGGSTPYTYAWSNAGITDTITGLTAGGYNVTVTDNAGCVATAAVTIAEPTAITGVIAVNNPTCGNSNGDATITVSGGTSPYIIAWSNGDMGVMADTLASGTYFVTITDGNSCSVTDSVTLSSAANIALAMASTDVNCNAGTDGTATANVSGGTAPYTYAWSNASTTASITGLMAGTYQVTINDASGCSTIDSAVIAQPTSLAISNVSSNVSCNGSADGSITLTVSGGTPGYAYLWNGGTTTASLTGIGAGNYQVTVTDTNGCSISDSIAITEPTAVTISIATTDENCGSVDGTATAAVTGGTGVYTFTWSNAATTAGITGLAAGTYTVTVSDANGCTNTGTATLSNTAAPSVVVSKIDQTCGSQADGQASVAVTGGVAPYTYAWSDGQTSDTAFSLIAGTYTVTVTSANGCTVVGTTTLGGGTNILVDLGADTIVCDTANYVLNAGSGFAGYLWSTGQVTQTINVLNTGTYDVTVTDGAGCTGSDTVVVTLSICVGLNEVASNVDMNLYPNPTYNSTKLELSGLNSTSAEVIVRDLNGRIIEKQVHNVNASKVDATIVVSEWAAGIYTMEIVAGDYRNITRLSVK